MITQKELAARLGLSRTTIARAINNSSNIKPETKEKILKLVKELGYEKNYVGSLLASKKKIVYSFIVESKNSYYTEQIKLGIKGAKKEYKHYNLEIIEIVTDINKPMEQVLELQKLLNSDKQIDGIIIIPLDKVKIMDLINPYLEKIKFISLSVFLSKKIAYVGTDYEKCGRLAAEFLGKTLNSDDKVLVIDNGDDNISSKYYLNGFLDRANKDKINIVGPIKKNGVEDSLIYLEDTFKEKNIKSIFINRYAQDILLELPDNILKKQKNITTGIGNRIRKLIIEKKILATVADDVYNTGYKACQLMVDMLYKEIGKKVKNIILEPQILLIENLK
ncbi:LacI family DNA-binding transcriptional regulator [Fusobacterium hwasookii]|uniref:LacI family transcriptional regulator n=2 Tax=Fusobacterium hwasookii TaxID=1583098 RepID=A0AAC9A156_9FUSO|nr:LacI family DNA-binding transcriptional regulator [Fusobacterium hwasookii]ALQ35179.1 LacI family transcriptional regulator [Fusobacterium hwasookii ChDC F206]ALQ38192.1 LacI family transcriptional regulator [Fusobacterium hwasookii ChDC F300]EJU06994.1 LacI family transcriptional regulator [Fusobacterium hwasookii ChDC F128]QNE66705.1 LacI family DNA-binding transcriptional regulator [Fusobacterium hwasookii]QNE68579.1 LacI family DNA-binding transcriptional regulator [Fusobacterium hwasoo